MKTGKEYWNAHNEDTIKLFKTRPDWMGKYDNDYPSAVFIRGLIENFKPANILEIGTAAGWAAYYMLEEAQKHNKSAKVTSIDLSDSIYYCHEKPIGAAFKETAPDLYEKWHVKTNITTAAFALNNDEKYDFVFIDANHTHPWATLDFIAVLPLLKDNAVVVFHDVFLNEIYLGKRRADRHPDLPIGEEISKGPNVLYKIFKNQMTLSYDSITPNCAAMLVTNKKQTLHKLFKALNKAWEYGANTDITTIYNLRPVYTKLISTNFGRKIARKFNKIIVKHYLRNKRKEKFKTINKLKKQIRNKRAVLWGASIYLKELIKRNCLNCSEIAGIIDINPEKTGQKIGNYKIYTPDALSSLKPQVIIPSVINHPQVIDYIEKELKNRAISAKINKILLAAETILEYDSSSEQHIS